MLLRRNRTPVVGVLVGDFSSDAAQEVVKLGAGQTEAMLKANLMEQMVNLPKLRTNLKNEP